MMNNKFKLSATIFASIIALAACGTAGNESDSAASESATEEQAEYTVGVVGDTERLVWEDVAESVADEGITLNVETFTDYVTPNTALADGSLDLNAFQHLAYLAEFVASNNADLVVANTNYAVDAGLVPEEDSIFLDTDDLGSLGAQYKNAVVVRSEDAENEDIQTIVEAYQSDETAAKIDEVTSGADQPAWTDNDDIAADFEDVVNQSEPAE